MTTDPENTAAFAERLRSLRRSRRLSYQKLAAATGIHASCLNRYEIKGVPPSIDALIALSDYFGVSADWLLKGAEPAPPAEADPELDRMIALLREIMTSDRPHLRSWAIVQFDHAFREDAN